MTLSADLRQLADLIDANPDLKFNTSGAIGLFLDESPGAEKFVDRVRALKRFGTVNKERGATMFKATVNLNESVELVTLDYWGQVACELVVTGTRTVERPVMQQVGVETVEEDVTEWRCPDSILAAS